MCQRSSAVWGRRQHRLYGYLLRGVAILWGIVGIVVAIAHDASTAAYLVTVALPSLPALLDASELADMHMAAANSRERLEERVDSLLQGGEPESQDLRDIQDQLFSMRVTPSIVPQWFYRLVRTRYEADMRDAAKQFEDGGVRVRMARSVNEGFDTFLTRLVLLASEREAASKHRASVEASLKNALEVMLFRETGSFNHGTGVHGHCDVDLLVSLKTKPASSDTALRWVKDALSGSRSPTRR